MPRSTQRQTKAAKQHRNHCRKAKCETTLGEARRRSDLRVDLPKEIPEAALGTRPKEEVRSSDAARVKPAALPLGTRPNEGARPNEAMRANPCDSLITTVSCFTEGMIESQLPVLSTAPHFSDGLFESALSVLSSSAAWTFAEVRVAKTARAGGRSGHGGDGRLAAENAALKAANTALQNEIGALKAVLAERDAQLTALSTAATRTRSDTFFAQNGFEFEY